MDAAEAFRDLPGLALLESARPGRTGRWSFLTADPVAVARCPGGGAGPVRGGAGARWRRHGRGALPTAPAALAVRRRARRATWATTSAAASSACPSIARVDQHLPVMRLALHDWAIAWDRRTGKAWLGGARRGRGRRPASGAGSARSCAAWTRWTGASSGPDRRPRPAPTGVAPDGPRSSSRPRPRSSRGRRTPPGSRAWRPSARRSAGARSTRRTSPGGSRRPSPATRGRSSGGCGPATRRCSPGTSTSGRRRRPARRARSCRPRPSRSSPSMARAASPPTRSRARARAAGPGTRIGRWPASSSPAARTRPRT